MDDSTLTLHRTVVAGHLGSVRHQSWLALRQGTWKPGPNDTPDLAGLAAEFGPIIAVCERLAALRIDAGPEPGDQFMVELSWRLAPAQFAVVADVLEALTPAVASATPGFLRVRGPLLRPCARGCWLSTMKLPASGTGPRGVTDGRATSLPGCSRNPGADQNWTASHSSRIRGSDELAGSKPDAGASFCNWSLHPFAKWRHGGRLQPVRSSGRGVAQ